MTIRSLRVACCLTLMLLALPVVAAAQAATGVGFAAIGFQDPVNGGTMPGFVFYPSTEATGVARLGPYEVQATAGAPPAPGAKPLVVISHGHAGSNLGHHDLATYLAGHGFVVATLEHPGDNFHDTSGAGTPAVLDGRPVQVKAAISQLLADPRWSRLIDPARIGVAGFSAGGYTALATVGAVPRFDRFVGYCERHPEDAETCVMLREAQAAGTADAALAELQEKVAHWGPMADPRVKAAFAMAPMSLVFDQAGLEHVDRPVFLYYGEHDEVLLPDEHVLHIQPLIGSLAGIRMVPAAGHYVFLAPCSPALAADAPALCRDPPGVDRAQVHAQVNADALAFFRKALAPAPQP